MRVPEVTLVFWIIKTLSTTVGETGIDFLAFDLGLGMPVVTLTGVMLYWQFSRFKRYLPERYGVEERLNHGLSGTGLPGVIFALSAAVKPCQMVMEL